MKQIMPKNKIKSLLYVLAGLGGVSLVIIIHEMGHFIFAKLFGVPTPIFSLGFGPALFSLPIGETLFQVALLPFGGYVEMNPEALAAQPYLPKMLIISAGILFNLVFAYCILLYYTVRNQFTITPTISTITPNSPAEQAGLQTNDILIAYNHEPINNNATPLLKTIAASAGKTILFTIERDGIVHEIPIQLSAEHPLFGPHTGWLGIELHKEPIKQTSFLNAIKAGHTHYSETIQNIGAITSKIMSQKGTQEGAIVGPIGIISMMGKSLAVSPQFFWLIVAMISLNIGLFNILPLPFFDGGKALIYTIEAVTGTTISPTILWYITIIFLALFMFFIARVTMNDVKRLGRK
jgi:regulator of sigma E protease